MTTTTETISLNDFHNSLDDGLSYLWFTSTACPAGKEFNHNTDAEGEAYCDLLDVIHDGLSNDDLFELQGAVSDGTWTWDGEGDPRDLNGNSYLRIVAR